MQTPRLLFYPGGIVDEIVGPAESSRMPVGTYLYSPALNDTLKWCLCIKVSDDYRDRIWEPTPLDQVPEHMRTYTLLWSPT